MAAIQAAKSFALSCARAFDELKIRWLRRVFHGHPVQN
jgi:hypothetical protein